MPRYKIVIEYDGTAYNGWQKQPKDKTVEGEIEKALSQIFQQPIDIIGQGRTDSGVHAEAQVAHFDYPKVLDKHRLLYALLGVLPRDIAVWDMKEVKEDFHARFSGKARQYRYQIVTRPSPLYLNRAEMVLGELNMEAVCDCAQMIKGTHNFEGFTKLSNEQSDAICEVTVSEVKQKDSLIMYRIKANRFVRHMVRRLVGTMIKVGQGKLTTDDFALLMENTAKDINSHGAAAKGLILERIYY